jgi:hypothetical protein
MAAMARVAIAKETMAKETMAKAATATVKEKTPKITKSSRLPVAEYLRGA